jgi:isoleucyl-tRNA synthetase
MTALQDVEILPDSAQAPFLSVLEHRPYWCVSRQRVWGAPIPAFHDTVTGEAVTNAALVERCCDLIDEHGTDFWWKLDDQEILKGTGLDARSLKYVVYLKLS